MTTVLGAFTSSEALKTALPRLHEAGFHEIETYTPIASEEGPSVLPLIILIAGVLGFTIGFGMQAYADMVSYPLNIGGRPYLSWPAFIPIAFEIGVMSAMVAGFFGYFVVNRLPHLYDPIDEARLIRRASTDRWCVAVRTERPADARRMLWRLAAHEVEEVPP